MIDFKGVPGKMCDWETVEIVKYAEEALRQLSQTASIYIATAAAQSTPEEIEKAFNRVELSQYIKGYFCKHNTSFTKPAPEFYLTIINELSTDVGSVTMVGDNLENDILPCHNLGLNTIWLTSEPSKGGVPEGVRIIKSLNELYS